MAFIFKSSLHRMKKHLLFITTLLFAGIVSLAQTQIPNSNFEQWENVGSNTEEPNEWNGIKTGQGSLISFAPKTVQRSTVVRPGTSGQYSARLYTGSALGNNLQGILTTGRVNVVSTSEAYIYTNTTNAAFNATMTDWPDSLVFWSRFDSGTGSDFALMRAVIHDNYNYQDPPDAASSSHVVGELLFEIPHSGTNWVRYAIPFDYSGPGTTPAFILISAASNTGSANSNDQLYLDDMELIYNPVTTTATNINPLSYTISATQGSAIDIPFTKTGIFHIGNTFTAELSDANGSFSNPIVLGTLNATNAGTITGFIPAGTSPGTGYRVRVVASTPYQTANDNGVDITIGDASNAIAPTSIQTIAANTNGTPLDVTEGSPALSREWKFATLSGGPYQSFSPAETALSYTPHFVNAGSYFIVCESTFGSNLNATSNEVQVDVVKNSISPGGTQSIVTGIAGNTLSVTETPTASSREWKFATTSGGPYQSFATTETGSTYDPLFLSSGLYYVVCESQISGVNVVSNQVVFSVGTLQITTGNVQGSPFLFSPSAPAADISVPFTVNQAFNPGNIFSAELSDANGSFSNPTLIGSLVGENSDTIQASIPANTPAGNSYLIRVTGSDLIVFGSDNGSPLTIDQYNNTISPASSQSILYGTDGNQLQVSESQNTVSREWHYSTNSGGPYTTLPGETGINYTPNFAIPGLYYVICASTNSYGDETLSNEVIISVQNGTVLETQAINGSPFYVSPSAQVTVDVAISSNIFFDSSNVFTVELSNAQGVFNPATVIGTLNGSSALGLTGLIANNTPSGTGYRIRVSSSSPAAMGTDNGNDLTIIAYEAHATPNDTQYVSQFAPVNPISFTCTHPFMTVEWKQKDVLGTLTSFTPAQTGQVFGPYAFDQLGTYTVVGIGTNQWGDLIQTEEVVFQVQESPAGISENELPLTPYVTNEQLIINLSNTTLQNPMLRLVNMSGQLVLEQKLSSQQTNSISLGVAAGMYVYQISDSQQQFIGKIFIR